MLGKTRKPGTDPNTPLLQAAIVGDVHTLRLLLDKERASGQQASVWIHTSSCGDPGRSRSRGSTAADGWSQSRNPVQPESSIPLICRNILLTWAWSDCSRQFWLSPPRIRPWSICCWRERADPIRAYALHQAAALGDPVVLRLLLAHPKVDVNQKNGRGSSPLLAAVTESPEDSCREVVEILLEARASVQREVSTWNWPLYRAVRQEKRAVVDLLTAHGAELNELRNTDLVHGAATSGTVRTLVYLKDLGLPLDGRNSSGTHSTAGDVGHGPPDPFGEGSQP